MITIESSEDNANDKKRNVVLSIVLYLTLIANFMIVKDGIGHNSNFTGNLNEPDFLTPFYFFMAIVDIALTVYLLKWKKWAFWGLVLTGIISLVVNLYSGLGIVSLLGALGTVIIFLLLLLKRNKISGWDNLE